MSALPHMRLRHATIALLAALLATNAAPGTAHAEARRSAQSLPSRTALLASPPARAAVRTPTGPIERGDLRAPLARAQAGGRDGSASPGRSQAGLARGDNRGSGRQRFNERDDETRHGRREFKEAEKRESHKVHHQDHYDSPGC